MMTIDTTETEQRVARKNGLPAPLIPLERLAWNYWWSWAADGESVFRDLDSEIWEECEHNPRQLLAKTSSFRLAEAATDPIYMERVSRLDESFQSYLASQPRLQLDAITKDHPVAYFCAEFGVHTSLPLYSGGLGILAGDHLKSASDLGLPLVAVGLLYRYGYFRQRLRNDGWQEEQYRETFPNDLPIHLIQNDDGTPLRWPAARPPTTPPTAPPGTPPKRATVAYLLGRQHLPTRRVAEAMADLFGLPISTGTVDSIYSDASRRLRDFIGALAALLAYRVMTPSRFPLDGLPYYLTPRWLGIDPEFEPLWAAIEELGVPVFQAGRGRYGIDRKFFLPPLRLSVPEAIVLFLASRLIARLELAPMTRHAALASGLTGLLAGQDAPRARDAGEHDRAQIFVFAQASERGDDRALAANADGVALRWIVRGEVSDAAGIATLLDADEDELVLIGHGLPPGKIYSIRVAVALRCRREHAAASPQPASRQF